MEVLGAILTTLLGVVLGYVVMRWDFWRETSSRGDLCGDWLSVTFGSNHEVIHDQVSITKQFGKLRLTNSGNEHHTEYEAFCTVENASTLTGTWRSTRPGALAKGRLLMFINSQATSIAGVYSGQSQAGKNMIMGWLLARSESDLERALIEYPESFGFGVRAPFSDEGRVGMRGADS